MSRRATITQADWRRAIKGALAAGLPVGSFKVVSENGALVILPIIPLSEASGEANSDWDEALERWRHSA